LIVGKELGLPQLKYFIQSFFNKIGIRNIKFKPAYNPYTEPSMEIFGYHTGLKKTIEIGNSGVFRPEMLKPMGFPEDVQVIAWGLSLERPAMMRFQCSNIRELFGYKADLEWI
jgi:phenylalanyl-tRNA synthetase alpha chain